MSDDERLLAIRVTNAPNQVNVLKAIRAATGTSMGEIRTALADQAPLTVAKLYGMDHEEQERAARTLLDNLDDAGVEFEVILNGKRESREYFINAMERWRGIGIETEMMSDLESGEPCIETLEWLRSTSPADVFRQTLRQVIDSDGDDIDAETREWARRQLDDA